jgi:hypothetical protein
MYAREIRPTPTFPEERDAVLLADYERGVPTDEILAALNALPGPVVLRKTMYLRAYNLGLSRSDEFRLTARQRAVAIAHEKQRTARARKKASVVVRPPAPTPPPEIVKPAVRVKPPSRGPYSMLSGTIRAR